MRKRAPLALAAVLCSGCAFSVSVRPPGVVRAPDQPIPCDTWPGPTGADAVCAGLFAMYAVQELRAPDCQRAPYGQECIQDRDAIVGTLLAVAGACLASGIWGVVNTRRCLDLKQVNALCIRGDRTACERLAPGWKPPLPAAGPEVRPAGAEGVVP